MIRTVNIDGKEMTAVILGDKWSSNPEDIRKALYKVLEMAVLNEELMRCSGITGVELYDYIRLIRAFETAPNEKGGEV